MNYCWKQIVLIVINSINCFQGPKDLNFLANDIKSLISLPSCFKNGLYLQQILTDL